MYPQNVGYGQPYMPTYYAQAGQGYSQSIYAKSNLNANHVNASAPVGYTPIPGSSWQQVCTPTPPLYPVYVDSNPASHSSSTFSTESTMSGSTASQALPGAAKGREGAEPTLNDRCRGLLNNRWYSQLHQLPTIKLSLDKLAKAQTQAINGGGAKFFNGLENVSDFVARTALKCSLLSLLILSASLLIAWPLSLVSVVTILPVTLGLALVGVIGKIVAKLANLLREVSIYSHFSSLLHDSDKQGLESVKKWDHFTKNYQKHFEDVEKQLWEIVKEYESIPQEDQETFLADIVKQMRENLKCVDEFKSAKTSIRMRDDLSLTRRCLGIA